MAGNTTYLLQLCQKRSKDNFSFSFFSFAFVEDLEKLG